VINYFNFYIPTGLGLILFIATIAITCWIYQDAKSRSMDEKFWAIITCFSGCIGCLIYLLVRVDNIYQYSSDIIKSGPFCPYCGTRKDPNTNTCPKCDIPPKGNYCSNCGNFMPIGNLYCTQCGAKNKT
jgi:hypothetical protein